MYKYRCVVSDNADEKVFCEVIDKVKKLYPNYIENEAEKSEESPAERLIKIPLADEKTANVCVKIDRSEKESGQVVVMTDTYLDGLFSEIYFNSPLTKGTVRRTDKPDIKFIRYILLCLGFLAVNWLILRNVLVNGREILLGVLVSIHIVLSLILKNKTGLSIFIISFIQLGGFFSFALCLLAVNIFTYWDALLGLFYFMYIIPVVAVSDIITSIILWIKSKMKGKHHA